MNKLTSLCAVALMIISGITALVAQAVPKGGGTYHTVSGNVRSDGVNLEGATVVLLLDANIVETTVTDPNGDFSMFAIEGVNYTASVYKHGHNFDPAFQVLPTMQADQVVNFQNGTDLCALTGMTELCDGITPTPISTIVNGIIAFEIFGNTFGVNADGTNQMQIPPAGALPSWSPDGAKLLYNRSTSLDFDQEIYITNANGTGSRQITFNFFNDYRAQWSPDETRAVFFRLFNTSDIEIFTVNTDSPNGGVNEVQLTNDDCLNRDPTYSPDGTRIAFSKVCKSPENASGIYTMNAADGSDAFQLTSGGIDIRPSWRPDGARIIFERDGNIWAVNPSGTGVAQMTFEFQPRNFSPVYSPDGNLIAFNRAPSDLEFAEIYTYNPQSTEMLRLTTQQIPFNKEYPSWQKVVSEVDVSLFGGVFLNFSQITSAGQTVATPISPASAGQLPSGYRMLLQPIVFDVRTTAAFVGDIEVCFDMSSVGNPKLFAELVVFHNEGGALIDRTSSRDFEARRICATVTSLSPFVVAAPVSPTSASVSVAGRVMNGNGQGVASAIVEISSVSGNVRSARTGGFGYFTFDEVPAGQTYTIVARKKGLLFTPSLINVGDDILDLEIVAEP